MSDKPEKPDRDERGRLLPGNRHRWIAGVSGNPGGAPAVERQLKEYLDGERKRAPGKLLTDALKTVLADEKVRKALAEKWIVQSASKAAFAQIVLERVEGRVPYSVRLGPEEDHESQTDLTITVVEVEAPPSSPLLKQNADPTE